MENWSSSFEDIVKKIKKKREFTKRIRDWGNTFSFPVSRVFGKTLAMDLVSVQPMSAPSMNFFYMDFDDKYKRRKKIVDKLLGKDEKKLYGEMDHISTDNSSSGII
jgi:hypothetical protein